MSCVLIGGGGCDCGVASSSCCCIIGEKLSAIWFVEVSVDIALLSCPFRAC